MSRQDVIRQVANILDITPITWRGAMLSVGDSSDKIIDAAKEGEAVTLEILLNENHNLCIRDQ